LQLLLRTEWRRAENAVAVTRIEDEARRPLGGGIDAEQIGGRPVAVKEGPVAAAYYDDWKWRGVQDRAQPPLRPLGIGADARAVTQHQPQTFDQFGAAAEIAVEANREGDQN